MNLLKTVKTGITLPKNVLSKLDDLIDKLGVKSRSKAITQAVLSYIEERESLFGENIEIISLVTFVYNHEEGETVKKLLEVQHGFMKEILFNVHIHLTRDRCLEIIIAKGRLEKIRGLVSSLENLRGVEYVKTSLVPY